MIYRKKTYTIKPEGLETFNEFFHTYLIPNQWKNGSSLVGRWVNEDKNEITAIWEYKSLQEYEQIEERVRQDYLHKQAQEHKGKLKDIILSSKQEFIESTGDYQFPKHIVAVGGLIQNDQGETLLVKTNWRNDTWELPGGQVEEGEPLAEALTREILEETGVEIELSGVSGVYQNVSRGIVSVVFKGKALTTEITRQVEEIQAARFVKLNDENLSDYITRPHMRSRALDALNSEGNMPMETTRVRPYELVHRFN
ncbi:NUDIX domain-containing protein [Alkalihalobacillus sp. AL-G]|uniref:NUDIX domain-containing protein n=1 Tax=Alkalihalobacillus sp. AL-G TaxID=2926399 RepID=UPI00272A9072|nr:NUDIX domain-containing protein [Alkalihalobacillus sp. AL-G]WLD94221.1 NUDIX domain-containing protein [Alkalihalobacillus sp. AL-G]